MAFTYATTTTYQGKSATSYEDGARIVYRVGGSRAWRDNNPGNLRHGLEDIGVDYDDDKEGFRIFPDYETGFKELVRQVQKNDYNGDSLITFYKNWLDAKSGDNPVKYTNFVVAYINKLYNANYTPDTIMGTLSNSVKRSMCSAMEKMEGYGNSGTVVNIN